MRAILITLALLLFISIPCLKAQEPFKTVNVGFSGELVIAGNSILDHWNETPGFSIELRSPYYTGEFEAGIRYLRYNEGSFDQSGFRSIFVHLGWFYPIHLSSRFTLLPGIRIGNHFLYQDNDKEYVLSTDSESIVVFHRDESEFAYEPVLRLEYELGNRISVFGSASYNRTTLNIPFAVTHFSFGIYRTFDTPGFLKKIAR